MENGLRHLESTQTGTMVPTHRAVYAYALAHEGHFERAAREAALVREEVRSGTERNFWTGLPMWLGDYPRVMTNDRGAEAEAAYTEALDHARQQRAIRGSFAPPRAWRGYGQTTASTKKVQPFSRR